MPTSKTVETQQDVLPEPMTMGEGDLHCAPECPYLDAPIGNQCNGTCLRDGKPLGFWDWYLAHCKGQYDELDVSSASPGSAVQD
jgi:hypothetical protein